MASCIYEPWSLRDLSAALNDMHIDKKQIVVPMFQRGKRWKAKQEETFIDSLKNGYPVGTMLFYRTVEGQKEIYTLVDGLQRGNTIKKFMASPTKYFTIQNIPIELIDAIISTISVTSQEIKMRECIASIIVDIIHSWTTFNGMQFYPIAKGIIQQFPTDNKNAVDEILEILQPFLVSHQTIFEKISNTIIPVIVYSGDQGSLPEIFDRINSKGTPLSEYEVFAASWPINRTFIVNNEKIVERVLQKYDCLADDDFFVLGYDREAMRKNKHLNAFEYVFGLSRYLNDTYSFLSFDKNSQDDVINPMAFELINACINDSKDKIKTLYNDILSIDINLFESRLIEAIAFVNNIINPIAKFKSNKQSVDKILHSKYQILSMISTTFREKYDIKDLTKVKDTWNNNKNLLQKNMIQHYVCDILKNEWNDGGTSKIHKAAKPNKYLYPISTKVWETTLDSYFEQCNGRQESKNIAYPKKEDIVILNCIYLPIFSAMDQLSLDMYDIEHIATKEQMKKKISICQGSGLPISSIGNLCYLPQKVNRSKGEKTFYQDKNYLKHIDLDEIESKYSFTKADDLKWLDTQYASGDFEVLKDNYLTFLKRRFQKQKQMLYNSLGIIISDDFGDGDEEPIDDPTQQSSITKEATNVLTKSSNFHNLCVEPLNNQIGTSLHKISRSVYASDDEKVGVIISVSKEYTQGSKFKYWFAYHPYYRDRLEKYDKKYVAFGCGSEKTIVLLSINELESTKINLNHTEKGDSIYWHIVFLKDEKENMTWLLSKPDLKEIDITNKVIQDL